jgi:nucleotidyltransferase/DNA polymerase involved in DNA repair
LAKAIVVLSETEELNSRSPNAVMNINKGVDKAYETMSLQQLVEAPVHALQGVSEKAGERLNAMGIRTIQDLSKFKYCKWAEALQTAAKFEKVANTEE